MSIIIRKTVSTVLLLSILTPGFVFAQDGEIPLVEIPETIDEAVKESREVGGKIADQLPEQVGGLWNERAIPLWTSMWAWTKNIWSSHIAGPAQSLWEATVKLVGRKIEEEKPRIKEELKKEGEELKEELKEEASKAGKSLWQRFLSLFRDESGNE